MPAQALLSAAYSIGSRPWSSTNSTACSSCGAGGSWSATTSVQRTSCPT